MLPYFRSNHQLILLDLLAIQHVVRPRLVSVALLLELVQKLLVVPVPHVQLVALSDEQ